MKNDKLKSKIEMKGMLESEINEYRKQELINWHMESLTTLINDDKKFHITIPEYSAPFGTVKITYNQFDGVEFCKGLTRYVDDHPPEG
jgi:hypothetical protein